VLKWGVAKLIAHSPVPVKVVPFYHHGMETVMPQDPVTRKVLVTLPVPGHDVVVHFGGEIDFSDLIREHEALHGPLWKYRRSVVEDRAAGYIAEDFHRYWDSSPLEKVLYHKICLRIEDRLRKLNELCLEDWRSHHGSAKGTMKVRNESAA